MKGLDLIIKFDGKFAYLTDIKVLPLHQLGLPNIVKRRGFKTNTIWELKILKYIPSDKRIFVRITSYLSKNTLFSINQSSNQDLQKIEKISFEDINTGMLIPALKPKVSTPTLNAQPPVTEVQTLEENILSEKHFIEESFHIPFKQMQFKDGHVLFEKQIPGYWKPIQFKIGNEHILEAFDAIKDYFAKVYKTKKVRVKAVVEIFKGEATVIEVHSKEIQRIDGFLIEQVRAAIIRSFVKKKNKDDQHFYTSDEFFSNFSGGKIQTDTFYDSEMAFLEELMKIQNAKHYHNLSYLAEKHAHTIMKLRFVFNPMSFIFLIEGKDLYHIIWETLKTEEATYIWQVEKDIGKLKAKAREVNEIINSVKTHGKLAYIRSEENNSIRVFHDYSDNVAGFKKWKQAMEALFSNSSLSK